MQFRPSHHATTPLSISISRQRETVSVNHSCEGEANPSAHTNPVVPVQDSMTVIDATWDHVIWCPESHSEPSASIEGRTVFIPPDILGADKKAAMRARTVVGKILDAVNANMCNRIDYANLVVTGKGTHTQWIDIAVRRGIQVMEESEFWSAAGAPTDLCLDPKNTDPSQRNARPVLGSPPGPVTSLLEQAICPHCHWRRPWGSCSAICIQCLLEYGHHRSVVGISRANWLKEQYETAGDHASSVMYDTAAMILEKERWEDDGRQLPTPRVSNAFTAMCLLTTEERHEVMRLLLH